MRPLTYIPVNKCINNPVFSITLYALMLNYKLLYLLLLFLHRSTEIMVCGTPLV